MTKARTWLPHALTLPLVALALAVSLGGCVATYPAVSYGYHTPAPYYAYSYGPSYSYGFATSAGPMNDGG